MAKESHVVGFRVGRETFGVPIARVHEIVRVPEITAVPDTPELIEGVINLRGRIISIIDLRKFFGAKESTPNKKNRILVVELADKMVGLIVDSASEVLKIPAADIDDPPTGIQEEDSLYVTGVGKLNGRLIILIDLARILQSNQLRSLRNVAEAAGSAA
jgi:purine-binding chemotaxis protein CheW